jgi:hypothetical protein
MKKLRLRLVTLDDLFAVCKLGAEESVPSWALSGRFCSMTRTPDELSIVCPDDLIPKGVEASRGWRLFRVDGKLDFDLVGVVSSLTSALAEVGISVFVISTYDTDYIFMKEESVDRGIAALRRRGHEIR